MKDHNPTVKFIDTPHYKGDDRRRQEIYREFLVLPLSQLTMNHQRKNPFMVNV